MVKEFILLIVDLYMKVTGEKTKEMGKGIKSLKMVTHTEVDLLIINRMAKVFTLGSTERSMMVTGYRPVRTGSEHGKDLMAITIRAIGAIISVKGMEFMSG